MRHQHFKQKHRQKESQAEGFALPLVIILGSVVLLGSVSTLGKVVSGKLGSVRQMQATQAREIAQPDPPGQFRGPGLLAFAALNRVCR